jgi:hypothetical protein
VLQVKLLVLKMNEAREKYILITLRELNAMMNLQPGLKGSRADSDEIWDAGREPDGDSESSKASSLCSVSSSASIIGGLCVVIWKGRCRRNLNGCSVVLCMRMFTVVKYSSL